MAMTLKMSTSGISRIRQRVVRPVITMCRRQTPFLFNKQHRLRFLSPPIILRNILRFGLILMTMAILTTAVSTFGLVLQMLGVPRRAPLPSLRQ